MFFNSLFVCVTHLTHLAWVCILTRVPSSVCVPIWSARTAVFLAHFDVKNVSFTSRRLSNSWLNIHFLFVYKFFLTCFEWYRVTNFVLLCFLSWFTKHTANAAMKLIFFWWMIYSDMSFQITFHFKSFFA